MRGEGWGHWVPENRGCVHGRWDGRYSASLSWYATKSVEG